MQKILASSRSCATKEVLAAPLTHLTAITFSTLPQNTTADPIKNFLQGQLTCDLRKISKTEFRPFAHCNLQGRMMSLGNLLQTNEDYLLIIPKSIASETITHLQKYAMFSKIKLQEKSDLFFYGLETESIKAPNSWPLEVHQVTQENKISNDLIYLCLEKNSARTRVFAISHSPLDLKNFTEKSEAWWLSLEIQNLTAFLTQETIGKFLPHEINLPKQEGVSFTKGCFLGQEVVARLEHLGKLKKQMVCEIHPFSADSSHSSKDTEPDPEVICACEYENRIYQLRLIRT